MIRATSRAAYEQIKTSGLLSRMRWLVYDHLFHHGPLTRTELDLGLRGPREVNPSYHKRLSELERMGVVVTVGRKTCSITGKECELWDVTANLPHTLTDRNGSAPTREEFRAVAEELRGLFLELYSKGNPDPFSPGLLRVCKWMAAK